MIFYPFLPLTSNVGILTIGFGFLLRRRLVDFSYLLMMKSMRKLLPTCLGPMKVTIFKLELF